MRSSALVVTTALAIACGAAARSAGPVPAPRLDDSLAPSRTERTAVVAGGCFWGIQAVFQHVKGVVRATAGYAGGDAATARYSDVETGQTGHAESVEIVYDASQITYGQLLRVFFSVAHDPTTLNRQGPDYGPQYRSAVFFSNAGQQKIAAAYISQLDEARTFARPIVTEVTALPEFYAAESYHQNYATNHPGDLYIIVNDAPKVRALKAVFPEIYLPD